MTSTDLRKLVDRCQTVMAHAWMVRTFVKHSPEGEESPELMHVARTIFDVSRAVETRLADPVGYFRMLGKKLHRLRQAADQFAADAPQASTHTNFVQAVISIQGAVNELETLLAAAKQAGSEPAALGLPNDDEEPLSGSDATRADGSFPTSAERDTET